MGLLDTFRKDTIYFPGCFSSAFNKDRVENYTKILRKLKISFYTLPEKQFVCCGGFLREAGYEKQLRKVSKSNVSLFTDKKIKKIITSCPLCYSTLKNYQEILPNFDTEIEFIISTILNAIKENEKLIETLSINQEKIAYYDNCLLARELNFVEQPREILRLLGFNLVEIQKYNKENNFCCGSCGNLPITNSALANKIAIDFIKMLKRKGIKRIITADARDFQHLKENLEFLGTKDLEVLDFSVLICEALGIKT